MRKLQKQRKSRITRKILIGTLVTGLTLLPGCKTSNNVPNHFKNKQPIVDNMEKQKERKIDLKSVPKKEKKGEKKEEPKKIKQEEKKQKAIGEIQGIEGFGSVPPYKKQKPRQPIH